MGAPAFDTHKEIKKLTEAGAAEPLAEAVVAAIGAAVSGELATKADLKNLEQANKAEFEAVRNEMKSLEQAIKAEIKVLEQTAKADIKALEQATKAEIKALEQSNKAEINALKQYMIIRMGGMFIVAVGIMIGGMALLR